MIERKFWEPSQAQSYMANFCQLGNLVCVIPSLEPEWGDYHSVAYCQKQTSSHKHPPRLSDG